MKRLLCLALVGAMAFTFTGCKKEEKQMVDISNVVNEKAEEGNDAGAEASKDAAEVVDSAEAESAEAESAEVDVKALADSLLNDITYTDQLGEVDKDTASMFLNFAEVEIEEAAIYESSGATAEEIVVLKCKDEASAAKAKTAFEQRVEEQIDNFTDYVPEELPKLKEAVISVSGQYAVLSVSGDSSKAKEIISGALK